MYKNKLFAFGLMTSTILVISLGCAYVSAYLTRANLEQISVAQSVLVEHQRLSSVSYRLFKQFTDEYTFGSSANQAVVRNKKTTIRNSLETIRKLELTQRDALGKEATLGSVEDTDHLEEIITQIIYQFEELLKESGLPSAEKQVQLYDLLEVKIDQLFREAIDAAVIRQGRVVATLESRIRTLNTSILWFAIGLGVVSLTLIIYGCYWLFGQLYHPLLLIKNATDRIATGNFHRPITEKLDEEFSELVGSINDMAKQLREHEAKEEASRKELEVEVEQRTAELTKANLKLTQQDAHRRQFINDISHELRTPLTIIRGESQITLRMESASEGDYRETLTSVLNQAIDLSRLVDDMLLLARAESNRLHLDLSPTVVVDVFIEESNKWNKLVDDEVVELNIAPEIKSIELMLDEHRIHQVLSILLDNATKYSNAGEKVTVNAELTDEYMVVSVMDRGVGISGAEVDHIFERFVRFRKSTEGVGLGLPIAKAIIEAHRGQIAVDSSLGQGSTFTFTLARDL